MNPNNKLTKHNELVTMTLENQMENQIWY